MPETTCHMSISIDGFVAGPEQSRDHPLGKRGIELHSWHIGDERANRADEIATGWLMRPRGAYVMGRNMFGPIAMDGGTTFYFVTDGFDAVYAQASEAARGAGVDIAGGASTVRQA